MYGVPLKKKNKKNIIQLSRWIMAIELPALFLRWVIKQAPGFSFDWPSAHERRTTGLHQGQKFRDWPALFKPTCSVCQSWHRRDRYAFLCLHGSIEVDCVPSCRWCSHSLAIRTSSRSFFCCCLRNPTGRRRRHHQQPPFVPSRLKMPDPGMVCTE